MAIVPTEVPVTIAPETAVATAAASPTVSALPDLVISDTLISGGTLIVTVMNQGQAPLGTSTIEVGIFDATGTQLRKLANKAVQSLAPGASINVDTGYVAVIGPTELLVIVDPNGKIAESDNTNNRLIVSLSPTVTPSETPRPTATLLPTIDIKPTSTSNP